MSLFRTRIDRAQTALEESDRQLIEAVKAHQAQSEMLSRGDVLQEKATRASAHLRHIERSIETWALLAKALGNDGIIALSIDDAGPTLSSLANELLLSSYGPRFTVSIKTQGETAKGVTCEDFAIVVHDAESEDSKDLDVVSGGERVYVNECLIRAIALYLAQNSGCRYQTLFSDETDGPLDPERKRMFMAMKRQVLDLGGYEREYFVSQTPELSDMADAKIDMTSFMTAAIVESSVS